MRRSNFLVLLIAVAGLARAETLATHRELDWSGPWRWVHFDHVDAHRYAEFENARIAWKAALQHEGVVLGDGRPLFWSTRGDSVRTYLTFYPFRVWADLDARAAMAQHTDELVGEAAVNAYDAGDAPLLPPHGSEIWRRRDSSDIVWEGTSSLTELTANAGRLERREIDWLHGDEFEAAWTRVQAALVAQRFPLAGRVYANSYGGAQGDWALFWFAPDAEALRNAPTLSEALMKQLGASEGARLREELARLFPVQSTSDLERRPDLSNLGQ